MSLLKPSATAQRRMRVAKSNDAVLMALQQLNHATAPQIVDWINQHAKGKSVSLTSAYRALNQLVKQAQVKPLNFNDGQVRYELNGQQMHHHHFICTECNHIQIVDMCPFEHVAQKLKTTFLIHYHNFEVYGLCQGCRKLA